MSSCSSCGAAVLWRNNASTGNPAPLDAEPHADGNCQITSERSYVVLSRDALAEAQAQETPLRLNHFVTCPNAARHHKAKAS